MFSAPLSNTIDKLLLATGDSDMKWKIGWGNEMEERMCKSFIGLLFLHAYVPLDTGLEVRLWAPLQWHMGPQNGSGKVHRAFGEHREVTSLCRLPTDWNPSVFWYQSSPEMIHHQSSSRPFLTQTLSPNSTSHLQYCSPYFPQSQNLNATHTLHLMWWVFFSFSCCGHDRIFCLMRKPKRFSRSSPSRCPPCMKCNIKQIEKCLLTPLPRQKRIIFLCMFT